MWKRSFRNIITEADAGIKIESYLKQKYGFSKKQISRLKFTEQGICINDEKSRVDTVLKVGDILTITMEEKSRDEERWTTEGSLESKTENLVILYEDEDLLIVEKPAGLVVHPSRGHFRKSLANLAASHMEKQGETGQIHCVGRLDKETAGIVLFAKNRGAAAAMQRQRETGALKKEYAAIVEGKFRKREGKINAPIRKIPGEKNKMEAVRDVRYKDAKRAFTCYQAVKEPKEDISLVLCTLLTGRTHQIRVHMAHVGHPLLGDPLYGRKENPYFPEMGLCAWKLQCHHPFEDKEINVQIRSEKWTRLFRNFFDPDGLPPELHE